VKALFSAAPSFEVRVAPGFEALIPRRMQSIRPDASRDTLYGEFFVKGYFYQIVF